MSFRTVDNGIWQLT